MAYRVVLEQVHEDLVGIDPEIDSQSKLIRAIVDSIHSRPGLQYSPSKPGFQGHDILLILRHRSVGICFDYANTVQRMARYHGVNAGVLGFFYGAQWQVKGSTEVRSGQIVAPLLTVDGSGAPSRIEKPSFVSRPFDLGSMILIDSARPVGSVPGDFSSERFAFTFHSIAYVPDSASELTFMDEVSGLIGHGTEASIESIFVETRPSANITETSRQDIQDFVSSIEYNGARFSDLAAQSVANQLGDINADSRPVGDGAVNLRTVFFPPGDVGEAPFRLERVPQSITNEYGVRAGAGNPVDLNLLPLVVELQ